MKVFIENEAGFDQKNIYDEKTLEYKKTYTVSRKYPFAYGFILNTTSGDGDNLDCFVITDKQLKTGQIVECEPIGIMEQFEDDDKKEDHNVLAKLNGESVEITLEIKEKLTEFVLHVFDHKPEKIVRVGQFLDKTLAEKYIIRCKDDLPSIIKEVGFDFSWDSEKVWKLDLPVEDMDMQDLIWHFDIPFWEKSDTDDYNLIPWQVIKKEYGTDEHRKKIDNADLKYPIDIMENKGRWLILDGLHRLVKAHELGQKTVRVRKVPREKISEILSDGK